MSFRFSVWMMALLALAGCASVPITPPADNFTVSGRYQLPKANGSRLAKRLHVVAVDFTAYEAGILDAEPADLRVTLQKSFNKSLINYGYGAIGTRPAAASADSGKDEPATLPPLEFKDNMIPVTMALELKMETGEENKQIALATFTARKTADHPETGCLAYNGKAKFTGVPFERSGNGARTFAFVMGVALTAAVGANGATYDPGISTWVTEEMTNADANEIAQNSFKDMAVGEGVARTPGVDAAKRHAAVQAIRLATAQYIAELSTIGDCVLALE